MSGLGNVQTTQREQPRLTANLERLDGYRAELERQVLQLAEVLERLRGATPTPVPETGQDPDNMGMVAMLASTNELIGESLAQNQRLISELRELV